MIWLSVKSQCTALLNWKSEFRGGSDSGFSSYAAPTYYFRSEYFNNQCPQVQNLIGTEHSPNRDEHRVNNKAGVISNSAEIGLLSSLYMAVILGSLIPITEECTKLLDCLSEPLSQLIHPISHPQRHVGWSGFYLHSGPWFCKLCP